MFQGTFCCPREVEFDFRAPEDQEPASFVALVGANAAILHTQARLQASVDDRLRLLELARRLSRERQQACHELRWRQVVPLDRPGACRCADTRHHRYPDWVPMIEIAARG